VAATYPAALYRCCITSSFTAAASLHAHAVCMCIRMPASISAGSISEKERHQTRIIAVEKLPGIFIGIACIHAAFKSGRISSALAMNVTYGDTLRNTALFIAYEKENVVLFHNCLFSINVSLFQCSFLSFLSVFDVQRMQFVVSR